MSVPDVSKAASTRAGCTGGSTSSPCEPDATAHKGADRKGPGSDAAPVGEGCAGWPAERPHHEFPRAGLEAASGEPDNFSGLRSALSITRERLSVALESARVGLWEIDLRTGVRWFSGIAAEIMGHPADEPISQEQSLDALHPDDRERVRSIVRQMIEDDKGVDRAFEYRLRRVDAEGPIWAVTTGRVLRDGSGTPLRVIGAVRDVTADRRQRDELARLAFEDDGTKLANRRALLRWLASAATADADLALLVLDIDDLKRTIDHIGSIATDRLIGAFAARLRKILPATSFLARLGGDEFAVAIPGGAASGAWSRDAKAIHSALKRPFAIEGGQAVFVEVSIGVAFIDAASRSIEDLLMKASLSMREAKTVSTGGTLQFTPAMQSARVKVRTVFNELPRAVADAEFRVYYQPQIRLADRQLTGAEALLRWDHPSRGLLTPVDFIGEIARSRWAANVGTHVLDTACTDAARLRDAGVPVQFGVNVFAAQFSGHRLDHLVKRMLAKYDIPASALEIEITEDIVLADDEDVLKTLKRLRDLGCGIAFDDYGTGYASLSMLKSYPVTRLKIDRSFVSSICQSPADRAIVVAVLGLGRTFGIDVIAEGIETEEQHQTLLDCGCTHAQGYLYGRPMPFASLVAQATRSK